MFAGDARGFGSTAGINDAGDASITRGVNNAGDIAIAGGTNDAGPPLETPALVFCRSRKRVETVARSLADALGWDRVGAYHAGMSKEERTAIEQWFFSATDAVLVATCAYGTP